jgi:hypothetical protein
MTSFFNKKKGRFTHIYKKGLHKYLKILKDKINNNNNNNDPQYEMKLLAVPNYLLSNQFIDNNFKWTNEGINKLQTIGFTNIPEVNIEITVTQMEIFANYMTDDNVMNSLVDHFVEPLIDDESNNGGTTILKSQPEPKIYFWKKNGIEILNDVADATNIPLNTLGLDEIPSENSMFTKIQRGILLKMFDASIEDLIELKYITDQG